MTKSRWDRILVQWGAPLIYTLALGYGFVTYTQTYACPILTTLEVHQ